MATDWLNQLRTLLGDASSVDTLDRFVSLRRSCQELRRHVWKAGAEAVVWLAAVGGAVAAGMALLVPELAAMYDAAGLAGSYRSTTRVVIAAAQIGSRWWWLALGACLIAGLWPLARRRQSMNVGRWLPVFGPLLDLIDRAEWSGMLGLMLAGRAAPQHALARLAELFHQSAWGTRSQAWAERMQSGQTLADVICAEIGQLPVTWKCLLPERSPNEDLDPFARSLETISNLSEAQARLRLTVLRAALRPVGALCLAPPGIVLLQAVCGPILTYLRTWN